MYRYIAFLRVLEQGSFTRAAAALGYSQSAVSQMIQSLEAELDVTLLHRGRHGVKLSPEGESLLPYIQSAVNHYNALHEAVRGMKHLEGGLIRIGTLSSYSSQWLPPLIKEFKALYPKVRFLFHQGDYSSIPEWIRTGEVDFGFINPDAETAAELDTIMVRTGGHKAILHPEHPLAKLETVPLQLLATEPFVLLETGDYSETLNAFYQEGLRPQIELRMHDNFSVCSMVEANVGVSILPDLALRNMSYRIVQRPTVPAITRKVGLVMKNRNTLPIASRRFIDFFLSRVEELP